MNKKDEGFKETITNPSMSRKIVTVLLKSKGEEITIIAAGDFHLGAISSNEAAAREFVKQIKAESEKHQTYLLLMGDIFDSISLSDKRANIKERRCGMDEAVKLFKDIFDPILATKRVKIIGSLIGNHELKYNGGDTDPIQRLYENTGIDHLGIKSFIYFDLMLGKKKLATFRTVAFHGSSNSRLPQGRMRIIREFLRENELTEDDFVRLNQVAFMGHTHDVRAEKIIRIIPAPRKGTFREIKQYTCNTGTFYDTANFTSNSYATSQGYNPSVVGYIKVSVSLADFKAVEVTNSGLNPNVSSLNWTQM